MDDRFIEISPYQRVISRWEIGVTDAVNGPEVPHVDTVLQLHLLRIALWHLLIAYLSLEISTFLQEVFTHSDTQIGGGRAHQDGR